MSTEIIFEDDFLVSGIMCYDGCGQTISSLLHDAFESLLKEHELSSNSNLVLDASPESPGVTRIYIRIVSDKKTPLSKEIIKQKFKESLDGIFDTPDTIEHVNQSSSGWKNWINISIGLVSLATILALSFIFPPSLILTISLSTFSIIVSTFLAREHLKNAYKHFKKKLFFHMDTTITAGWGLSLIHTIYHSISMPFGQGISMSLMSYIMPVGLLTMINVMDEIKRLVNTKSTSYQLNSLDKLFPELSDDYLCAQFEKSEKLISEHRINPDTNTLISRQLIKKGDVILIKQGQCLPVDGVLMSDYCCINAALLTGESSQTKHKGDMLPAGGINLNDDIWMIATENSYHSSINRLLFRANRAESLDEQKKQHHYFLYFYLLMFLIALVVSLVVPMGFGVLTLALALQSMSGIFFALCPCTLSMAESLPELLTDHQRQKNGIIIRHPKRVNQAPPFKTIVFDKTGTLTTGNSMVHDSSELTTAQWARLYLLEKKMGGNHPLAKAVLSHHKRHFKEPLFDDIEDKQRDSQSRGISARIQGKQVCTGSLSYLIDSGIKIPKHIQDECIKRERKGLSVIHLAEDGDYVGYISIKHQVRSDVKHVLQQLISQGINIIMLTGDGEQAAHGFNKQIDGLFKNNDIHASQTPKDKELFLTNLMQQNDEVLFVCDGLNDAPSARLVTEKGGISCAMNREDKVAFFTDMTLNGQLDYLLQHQKIKNRSLAIKRQNQLMMLLGIMAFAIIMTTFSVTGIAMTPLVPLLMMTATTLMVLTNSYRAKVSVDVTLNPSSHRLKRLYASDLSLVLLASCITLAISAILIASIGSGGLAIPIVAFGSGVTMAVSSSMLLIASMGALLYCGLMAGSLISQLNNKIPEQQTSKSTLRLAPNPPEEKKERTGSVKVKDAPQSDIAFHEPSPAATFL